MKRGWLAGLALGTAAGALWWRERATGDASRRLKYAVIRGTQSARLVRGREHAWACRSGRRWWEAGWRWNPRLRPESLAGIPASLLVCQSRNSPANRPDLKRYNRQDYSSSYPKISRCAWRSRLELTRVYTRVVAGDA